MDRNETKQTKMTNFENDDDEKYTYIFKKKQLVLTLLR